MRTVITPSAIKICMMFMKKQDVASYFIICKLTAYYEMMIFWNIDNPTTFLHLIDFIRLALKDCILIIDSSPLII